MKKTLKLFALTALFAAVFSCTKEADTQNNNDKPETTVEESGQPRTPAGQESSNCLLSFGADIVSPFDTKAVIDLENKTVSFEAETDKVLVVNGADNKTYVYNGSSFVAESEPVSLEGTTIYAYYPASAYSVDAEGNVTFTMPEYLGSLEDIGDKAPMAGVIAKDGDDYKASFKNVASILEVGITGNRQLSSVVLTANETIGNGSTFSVSWNEGNPALAFGGGSNKSMTVISDALLSDTPTKFYFIVPAGVDLTGVNVNANLKSADAGGFKYFYLDRGNWNATRNKIYKMSFYAGLFSGGAGTEENPYKIANARDFKYISKYCAPRESQGGYGSLEPSHFLGAHYIQTDDIDFKGANISQYLIAGVINGTLTSFEGSYDGKPAETQYSLTNFVINATPTLYNSKDAEGIALFKRISGATLKNISISQADIKGGKFTAGLVGYVANDDNKNNLVDGCSISDSKLTSSVTYGIGGLLGGVYAGSIINCVATNLTIKNTGGSDPNFFGGIISYINGSVTVDGCSTNGNLTIEGTMNNTGAIVGETNNVAAVIKNCTNNAIFTGGGNYIGGIVGHVKAATPITKCENKGTVSAANSVGGIVGSLEAASVISGCVNSGTVSGTGNWVGGIVAYDNTNGATITKSEDETYTQNNGTVEGKGYAIGGIIGGVNGSSYKVTIEYVKTSESAQVKSKTYNVGGVIGRMVNGTVSFSENKSKVEGPQGVGGIVGCGITSIDISNCNNSGTLECSGNHAGGIVGQLPAGKVSDCVNTGDVFGAANVGGITGNHKAGDITNCRSNANIVGTGAYVGGIAGIIGGACTIQNTYSKGSVKAKGDVGGFVGRINDPGAKVYIVNCAAGANVMDTNKAANDGAGGFIGYLRVTNADKAVSIANCVVWDVLVKAPNENGSADNKVRVGGFAGVTNPTVASYTSIQNCYTLCVSVHLGYGGGENWTTNPTVNVGSSNRVVGGFSGYAKGTYNDNYCIPNFRIGGGQTGNNNTRLTADFMNANTESNPALTTTAGTIAANTKTFGKVLDFVASGKSVNEVELASWDYYIEGGKYYYYPSTLTSLGEDFYQK